MAKIGKDNGPSDELQAGEPLHLLQAEVVPGSKPESAQIATTAAVLNEGRESDAERAELRGDPAVLEAAHEVADQDANADAERPNDSEHRDDQGGDALSGDAPLTSDGRTEHSELDLDDPDVDDEEEDDDSDDFPPADDQDAVVEDPDEEVGPTTSTVEYDPSLYTVDEVNAYLTERSTDGDDEEVDRVLAAERGEGGKQRAGILNRWP